MSKDILLGAFYTDDDGLGVTGLTVTIDIHRVAVADLASTEIVTAGACTSIGDGLYAYRVASADLQTYYYFGVCKTAGTVAQAHLAAVQLDFADSPGLVTLMDVPTAAENATALLDTANGVETSFTPRQALRLLLAALAGKLSISGNTVTIRDVNDTTDRIVATTDSDGQRTAVTTDVS